MKPFRSLALSAAFAAGSAGPAAAGDNLAVVQDLYAAFGAGDIPAILAQLSDDVEWDYGYEGTSVPFLTPRQGPEEVAEFFDSLAGLEFRKFEVVNLLEGGSQVAAVIDIDVVVRETGKSVADQEVHLWTFGDDGKVHSFRHFVDSEEFAAAVAD